MRGQEEILHTANELPQKDAVITQAKEQWERIIHTAPVSFMMTAGGKVTEINRVMQRDTGLDVGSDIGQLYSSPEERTRLRSRADAQGNITNEVARVRLSDGQIHRCLLSVVALEGQTDAYAVWALDIEQDERQKDQLMMAQKSLQMLLDVLPIAVRIVDIESETIIYVNNAFLDMFQYGDAEEICGRKLIEIVPDFQNDGVAAAHKKNLTMSTSGHISVEVDYVTGKGDRLTGLLISRHINYNGKAASLGIIRDMGKERRETELRHAAFVAEQASRAKSTFIANMSHEIRTPMNSIVGFAELALAGKIPPQTRDYLIKIRESSHILLRIINDILDISKIESGKIELETIPFDLHEVFLACQTIIASRAIEKGITLYCYAEPSIGKTLLGDPTKLRQALFNLLSNAVKFTSSGMVKLLAAVEEQTGDCVNVRFEVKDSGIGMTPEQLAIIFDPFVQADESTTRKYGGTGLGLPITKNIVELMGGTLNVESTLGVGSKFSFSLTFKTDTGGAVPNTAAEEQLEKPIFSGEVLICEDNAMNREVICGHLENVGIKAVTAVNGQEGVDAVTARKAEGKAPFDLILMDIHMPVMDGLEATQKLAELGNPTPVVALTANVMVSDRKTYQEYGMRDYLAKPFKTEELWACLSRYLVKRGFQTVAAHELSQEDAAQLRRQRIRFTRDQRDTVSEMEAALREGSIKQAARLAHTLKGVAGLVDKPSLRAAAAAVERSLNEGAEMICGIDVLKREHEAALAEFALLTGEETPAEEWMNREQALELLEALDAALKESDAESLSHIPRLRAIPGTDVLIVQLERYDFPEARETLAELKRALLEG